jgi:UDP-N-acetylglucosamine 1-carboxyvinyltransferase
LNSDGLTGADMLLDEVALLLWLLLAKGITTVYNAACEPYLQQLCKMLNSMGAKITGVGSNY